MIPTAEAPTLAEAAPAVSHADMANAIRALTIDVVQKANSGHPGMPMGMTDVATVLFTQFLKFDPAAPDWPDRDRFVLSAGHGEPNRVSRGAYLLKAPDGPRDVTLIATGSEVSIACQAAELLFERGFNAAVVSMPCADFFRDQPKAYRDDVLGTAPRIAIEAAVRDGWDRWIGPDGIFIGMDGFGASAPADELYRHFGIAAEAVAEAALDVTTKIREAN